MRKIFLSSITILFASVVLFTGCDTSSNTSSSIQTSTMTIDELKTNLNLKTPDPVAKKGSHILFVGNSHTFTNDLPQIFYNMTLAFDKECEVYELTEGGYYLQQFDDPNDELGAKLENGLKSTKLDFVILQDNTNASASDAPDKDMYPYITSLDTKIKQAGAQTALFMTWAPKNGISSTITLTRDEIQSTIANNYITAANQIDGLLFPAGIAFSIVADKYPEIELWDQDEMHPSLAGSYLASCIMYAQLFQESPEGCTYIDELDPDTASILQATANELILKNNKQNTK